MRYIVADGRMELETDDGKVIDFTKAVRVIKERSNYPRTVVEGLVIAPIDAESNFGDAMIFHLHFFGDTHTTWIPGYGDILENVE